VIAQELFTDEAISTRVGTRSGRARAALRRRRTIARRYRSVRFVILAVVTFTVVVVGYLGLLERITQMNYERAVLAQTQARLEDDTEHLEDRLQQLQSRERLAAFAHRLSMRDPGTFAVATVRTDPAPAEPAQGLAFLTGWLR